MQRPGSGHQQTSYHNPEFSDVTVERDVPFALSDGVTLYADIYRPTAPGRFPALLNRVPYNKSAAQAYSYAHPIWYARHGYVVVVQDARGRWRSEGDFYPVRNEAADGYETVDWIAGLPYCNGKVGLYGYSYPGMTQLLTAALQPPALRAVAPAFAASDHYNGWAYHGGAFALGLNAWWTLFLAQDTARRRGQPELEMRLNRAAREMSERYWSLPLTEIFPRSELEKLAPYYFDWLEHPMRDEFWKDMSVGECYDDITVPALHIGGWYDSFLEGTLCNYVELNSRERDGQHPQGQRLIVGPWYHNPWSRYVGSQDFGPKAQNWLDEYHIRWFDYRLKDRDTGIADETPVKIFVMGANAWRDEHEWPLARTEYVSWHLHSTGRANSLSGNGSLSLEPPAEEWPDVYVYDPRDPVLSVGGRSCCVPDIAPMGPADQRPVEVRNDVLAYTSEPLQRNLEVTGPVVAQLWASSTAPDTDFTVKLVDVHPDGTSINLCEGILRTRFRESLSEPSLIEPNEVYKYEIVLGSTSNVFRMGHRIRVHVSSSNFPAYDRNANVAEWPAHVEQSDLQVATQTVFHDTARPSHVTLPVIRS